MHLRRLPWKRNHFVQSSEPSEELAVLGELGCPSGIEEPRGGAAFGSGEDYRQAKVERTEEYLEAVQRGEAATARSRASGSASFGPKTRDVRRKQETALRTFQALRGEAAPPMATAPAIAGTGSGTLVSSMQVQQGMTAVRRQARMEAKHKRLRLAEDITQLQAFSRRLTAQMQEELFQLAPALLPLPTRFTALPSVALPVLRATTAAADSAVAIAAWAAAHSRTSNLQTALRRDALAWSTATAAPQRWDAGGCSSAMRFCVR